jgi:hypothetical protein
LYGLPINSTMLLDRSSREWGAPGSQANQMGKR